MRPNDAVWPGLVMLAALAALAAHYYAYFPGDVALAQWVQSRLPPNLNWAAGVSRTAEFPGIVFILALVCALSWLLAGRRAALLAIFSLAGMWAVGTWLGPVIARPRPASDLVQVLHPLAGSSFPSLFALRYAATFGFLAVLAALKGSGRLRLALLTGCGLLLILGWVARVGLAAHWPSDVLLSYYLGFLWAACLIRFAL